VRCYCTNRVAAGDPAFPWGYSISDLSDGAAPPKSVFSNLKFYILKFLLFFPVLKSQISNSFFYSCGGGARLRVRPCTIQLPAGGNLRGKYDVNIIYLILLPRNQVPDRMYRFLGRFKKI